MPVQVITSKLPGNLWWNFVCACARLFGAFLSHHLFNRADRRQRLLKARARYGDALQAEA